MTNDIANDNKLAKFTTLVLLITLITLVLVSSTYAKYATEVSGTATATVAKFAVTSNTTDESFNLFETIAEVDGTTTEADVATGKIAPGTGGKFAIELQNDSEVSVSYNIAIEETKNDSNVPIEYSVDGTNYVTADKLAEQADANGELKIGGTTSTNLTVYWRWAFEGEDSTNYTTTQTDDTDTDLGEATTAPTVEVTASTVFTQID